MSSAAVTVCSTTNVESLARELRSNLTCSAILTPDSEGYTESIERWTDTTERKPGIVLYAGSTEDISATILGCRKHNVSFAVSGGRHSTSGASSIHGGVAIDLRRMRRVAVDPNTKTIKVQGGCIWQDVDEAAGEHGLATVGGTVNDTGVGGLTLGGGYGWLSGRHGLVIDNLLAVEIVLADGSSRTASREQNPDLFWAVRGAGQCFGVVTEFTFQAHDQKNRVWAGVLGYHVENLETLVSFANDLVASTNGDSGMMVQISSQEFTQGKLAAIAIVFHNGAVEAAQSVFQPLLDLNPLLNTAIERPYCEVNGMMNPKGGRGFRSVFKGVAFTTPLRPAFMREILIPELNRLYQVVPASRQTLIMFEFFRSEKWCEIPVTETAFGHRGPHQNAVIAARWRNDEDDEAARQWTRAVAKLVVLERQQRWREQGVTPDEILITEYGNYDHLSAKPRNVFGVNLERLIEIKKKYDPENIFNKSYIL